MQYFGNFSSKEDICHEFAIEGFDGVVLYASYTQECYEGQAHVLYMDGSKFYYVESGHCSCHGLEGSWAPDEITIGVLLHMAREGEGIWKDNSLFIEALGRIVNDELCSLDNPEEVVTVLRLLI